MTSEGGAAGVPEGYHQIIVGGGFRELVGPYYATLDGGVPVIGFRVEERHCNPTGDCDGGVIAALADLQGFGAQELAEIYDRYLPTISLSLDFIAPARFGTWVEMRIELLRASRSLLFTQAKIFGDGKLIARTHAVYKNSESPYLKRDGTIRYFT